MQKRTAHLLNSKSVKTKEGNNIPPQQVPPQAVVVNLHPLLTSVNPEKVCPIDSLLLMQSPCHVIRLQVIHVTMILGTGC
jgi:hypothetical protein